AGMARDGSIIAGRAGRPEAEPRLNAGRGTEPCNRLQGVSIQPRRPIVSITPSGVGWRGPGERTMNLKVTWATVLAVALATLASPAFADARRGHGHHDRREYRHDYRREVRHDRRDHRYDRHHRAPVRVVHHHHHAPPRHAGPPRWARGGYVHHYHHPVYVVHDY